jgi:hypothetical protein
MVTMRNDARMFDITGRAIHPGRSECGVQARRAAAARPPKHLQGQISRAASRTAVKALAGSRADRSSIGRPTAREPVVPLHRRSGSAAVMKPRHLSASPTGGSTWRGSAVLLRPSTDLQRFLTAPMRPPRAAKSRGHPIFDMLRIAQWLRRAASSRSRGTYRCRWHIRCGVRKPRILPVKATNSSAPLRPHVSSRPDPMPSACIPTVVGALPSPAG